MSASNSTSRTELMKIVSLLRPALSTQDYIPALKHICFDAGNAVAYNDTSAISVAYDMTFKRLVPGDLLIRALGSLGGEKVAITYDEKTSVLLLASGRSKLKLPTMPAADFPFEGMKTDVGEVPLTKDMLRGIQLCLLSVGADPTHPAQMGVTLEINEKGHAEFFSTDNFTISRYETTDKVELPGDSPIILPTFFCDQILTLGKAFPNAAAYLIIGVGALLVEFVEKEVVVASTLTKTVVDIEPMDFHKIMKKHCDPKKLVLKAIPDDFDASFNRALLVLGSELDKSTKVDVLADKIVLETTSAMGDVEDDFDFGSGNSLIAFTIDPSLVVRASKTATKVAMLPKVMVLSNEAGDFLHLIAHCVA